MRRNVGLGAGVLIGLGLIHALALSAAPATGTHAPEERRFEFVYEATVELPADARGPVHVFVPLPRSSAQQEVHQTHIDASIPGQREQERVYGNEFWHGVAEAPRAEPIRVLVRSVVTRAHRSGATAREATTGEAELTRFLGPNERVVVGHEVLQPIREEIRAAVGDASKPVLARGIYDWVVDNVTYKKVGTGWGNGDTFWACSERYGNCTDFHALFISLARSEDIPGALRDRLSAARATGRTPARSAATTAGCSTTCPRPAGSRSMPPKHTSTRKSASSSTAHSRRTAST